MAEVRLATGIPNKDTFKIKMPDGSVLSLAPTKIQNDPVKASDPAKRYFFDYPELEGMRLMPVYGSDFYDFHATRVL